jgi:hypothetical protein
MLRTRLAGVAACLIGCSLVLAQGEDKLKVGAFMPGPFECYNVNGPAKGRPHCLVCKFGLNPSVLVFAKEPAEGKDAAFNELMKKLDEMAAENTDRNFCVGLVILSPAARDSSSETAPDDKDKKELSPDELAKEAVEREKLIERLDKRAKDYKHLIVATYVPPGPKAYGLDKDAEMTVLFFDRVKIRNKWVFAPDKLEAKEVDAIAKTLSEGLKVK